MSWAAAIAVVTVAAGLVTADIMMNEAAALAYLTRGLIGIVEWIAFWR